MNRHDSLPTLYVPVRRSARKMRSAAAYLIFGALLAAAPGVHGDEFSRLEGPLFFDLIKQPGVHTHKNLTLRELDALPAVLRDERSTFVIVQTDQGNLAKVLVSVALRKLKPSARDGAEVRVLVLERFETLDAGDRRSLKARGKELTLFDGFQFDLDSGQVVPANFGGDIGFLTDTPVGPRLATVNDAQLYTIEKSLAWPAADPGQRSGGRSVEAADFAGRYTLMANGQWSGTLVLAVDSARGVSGHFRSDKNGSAYPVTGKIAAELPYQIEFEIQFPRARQTYQGLLWTEGKNVIGGTLSMLERSYSFIAVREGTSPLSEIDLGLSPGRPANGKRRVVSIEAGSDRFTIDGRVVTEQELSDALSQAARDDRTADVLLRVGDSVPFERIRRAVAAIRAAGVSSARLSLSTVGTDTD